MFGYIVPYKDEMKVKDYEMFRSYYCGLCRAIGHENGQLPRFALNYDIAFLGLFLSSLGSENSKTDRKNCIAHPLSKRSFVYDDKALEYTANIGTMLAYFNLIDNWNDDRSKKSYIGALMLKRGSVAAKRRYESKYDNIENLLSKLSVLEKNGEKDFDKTADVFGKIMEEICDYDAVEGENERIALRWLGYNTGRWIYILDAYDDISEDFEKMEYNPLIAGLKHEDESIEAFRERIKDRIEFTLIASLSEIAKSFELLNIKKNKEIIENIVYIGMRKKMDSVLKNCEKCAETDKSVNTDKSISNDKSINTELKGVL